MVVSNRQFFYIWIECVAGILLDLTLFWADVVVTHYKVKVRHVAKAGIILKGHIRLRRIVCQFVHESPLTLSERVGLPILLFEGQQTLSVLL